MPSMIRLAAVALLCQLASAAPAAAEEQSGPPPDSAKDIEQSARQRELDALVQDLQRSRDQQSKLKEEIDRTKDDRKKFAQDLLETTSRIRAAEAKLTDAEKRLSPLDERESILRQSLAARDATLSKVLGALERLGLRPAPTLILRSETTLELVRTAILLGALVPQMRAQAESLAADLAALAHLRKEIAFERDTLTKNRAALAEEQLRLSVLVEERQRRQGQEEKALEAERTRALALARQVETVQDLVSRMEREIETAKRAAERAQRESTKTATAGKSDPLRIAPAVPFPENKGKLAWPVTGRKLHEYGATNGLGGVEKGLSIATRSGAQVVAPSDGWVVFAGNFRNYGQLLIINVGGGYHILLAGMERITVDLGQFVLSGEPVAVMGSAPRVASVSAFGSSAPVLYVEFRKDGTSIDPSPWWATTEDEKVRG